MTIDASLRDAALLDRGGYAYVIHPLMDGIPRVRPALLREFSAWASGHPALDDATVLLAPEAMGVPLAAAVSLETDIPYLVLRKRRYDMPGETVAYCETGYGQSCLYVNGLEAGDRVVVIDDVISTGGTLDSLLATLKEMGVTVQAVLAFIDKGDKAATLAERHGLPIEAMRDIRIEDGRIIVEGA